MRSYILIFLCMWSAWMVFSLSAGKQGKFRFFINVQNLVVADPQFKENGEGFLPFSKAKQVFQVIKVSPHWSFNQVIYNQSPNGVKIDRSERKLIAKVM